MQLRRRFKQSVSLKDRLAAFAKEVREKANQMPSCRERDDLLKKASQADTASHLDDWANSPGLRSPK
jgi:hypothetical protein